MTAAASSVANGATRTLLVPGLSTPAVTLGLLRPVILLDATFWETATEEERDIIIAHENGHRRGGHGLLDMAARFLAAGLSPLPGAVEAQRSVRRHLEALADDAAVRRHDRRSVGLAIGRIALSSMPAAGLGAAGASVWRVHRLIVQPPPRRWRERMATWGGAAALAVMLLMVAADAAVALGPLAPAQFCPV